MHAAGPIPFGVFSGNQSYRYSYASETEQCLDGVLRLCHPFYACYSVFRRPSNNGVEALFQPLIKPFQIHLTRETYFFLSMKKVIKCSLYITLYYVLWGSGWRPV